VLSGFLAALIVAGATVLWSKAWRGYDAAQEAPDPQRADVVLALSQLHIGNGEIIRARELLAANKSLAPDRIALALGETYDPNVLPPWQEGGVPADADRARSLYLEALRFGSQTAKKRLEDLDMSGAFAERALERGRKYLEEGQIAASRGYFQRVHGKGLAVGPS
jgi:hypothetical protein